MARGYVQERGVVERPAVGPEPIGADAATTLHTLYGLTAWGAAAPDDDRWGLAGAPETTSYADLGALQGFKRLRTNAAKGTNIVNGQTGLPATSTKTGGVQGLLGTLGV